MLTLPLVAVFTAPMFLRQEPKPLELRQKVATVDDPLAGLADIQDVLVLIKENHVDVPDIGKALAGGMQAALQRANLLNSYISPEEAHLTDPGPGETGLTLLKQSIVAIVSGVVPDSPADEAGIKIGDVVRKLNGESIVALSQWAIERKLRGAVGSEISLALMPNNSTEQKKVVLARSAPKATAIQYRLEASANTVVLTDIKAGRAKELEKIFIKADSSLPLVIDLRTCNGGSYQEAAQISAMLGCSGIFATLQETGQPDQPLEIPQYGRPMFSKIAVLIGSGTIGPSETLAVALKQLGKKSLETPSIKKTVVFLGERTYGQAVERTRYNLKQGGAVELVTKCWLGASGEKLGLASAGGRLDKTGLVPDYSLRGIPDNNELLPRILEALEKGTIKPKDTSQKVATFKQELSSSDVV